MNTLHFIAAATLCMGAGTALAHEAAPSSAHAGHTTATTHASHSSPQTDWGQAGNAHAVTRTITLRMSDDMRFAPRHFSVQLGETVRLRVENQGQILHEVVLGTPASLDAHAQNMLLHPGMAHAEAHMAHVAPARQGELVWNFNRAGQFDFACLIAGHYQAGMRGTFTVTP